MTTKPKTRWRSGPSKHPGRKDKRIITLFFTDAEFEAVTRHTQRDGTTKQEIGTRLFLDYAKRGLTNG
jgi:hypothetical protein